MHCAKIPSSAVLSQKDVKSSAERLVLDTETSCRVASCQNVDESLQSATYCDDSGYVAAPEAPSTGYVCGCFVCEPQVKVYLALLVMLGAGARVLRGSKDGTTGSGPPGHSCKRRLGQLRSSRLN